MDQEDEEALEKVKVCMMVLLMFSPPCMKIQVQNIRHSAKYGVSK